MLFTHHTTFSDLPEAEWNALLAESHTHVPFLRHEYLRTWAETRGGGEWPPFDVYLVTARDDAGRLLGIAPLFYDPAGQRLMLLGSIEISDYLDLIVRLDDLPAFAGGLLAYLPNLPAPWRSLDLYNLLDTSPTLAVLASAAHARGWVERLEQLQHSPYIPLPGDWETYLAGIDKKQRHEIRRKMRRMDESGIPWRWYVAAERAALPAEIEAFLALMAQDPAKAAFLTPPMRAHMRQALECAFDAGCLQLAFLEINGEKAAAYLNFDYLNRLWIYNSGLDRRFMEYSPGWVLLGHLLMWANENGRDEFDFMRGDEDYKYKFGALDRFVLRLTLER